jgi:hypothetical protein
MKKIIMLCALAIAALASKAQDTVKTTSDAPLVIYGSVDAYYKYDFSGHKNIGTSFASDQNSVSIGMVDLGFKKSVGAASFVGELSFGPRSDASIANAGYHIQNLYVNYALTSKLTLTAGFMATFLGYEVIAPTGNFNYSTSYLFTNGPFQNAGIKATYAFSDKASLMVGAFNDSWNVYTGKEVSTFGAQLMLVPVTGWTAYLNVLSGPYSGTEFDLTTAYQITPAFKLGLNAADFSPSHYTHDVAGGNNYGFTGVALYPQLAVSKVVTLGLRGEYFKTKTDTDPASLVTGAAPGGSVMAYTLTANIKSGPLTFIPEVRLDNVNSVANSSFTKSTGIATKSASQFLLAAVYAF